MEATEKPTHRLAFSTAYRAGCACGFVAEKTPREGARRRVIRHITNPQAPGKIADAPYEHANCHVEPWSVKWGICTDHRVYIDLEARGVDPDQTALPVTLVGEKP